MNSIDVDEGEELAHRRMCTESPVVSQIYTRVLHYAADVGFAKKKLLLAPNMRPVRGHSAMLAEKALATTNWSLEAVETANNTKVAAATVAGM